MKATLVFLAALCACTLAGVPYYGSVGRVSSLGAGSYYGGAPVYRAGYGSGYGAGYGAGLGPVGVGYGAGLGPVGVGYGAGYGPAYTGSYGPRGYGNNYYGGRGYRVY